MMFDDDDYDDDDDGGDDVMVVMIMRTMMMVVMVMMAVMMMWWCGATAADDDDEEDENEDDDYDDDDAGGGGGDGDDDDDDGEGEGKDDDDNDWWRWCSQYWLDCVSFPKAWNLTWSFPVVNSGLWAQPLQLLQNRYRMWTTASHTSSIPVHWLSFIFHSYYPPSHFLQSAYLLVQSFFLFFSVP